MSLTELIEKIESDIEREQLSMNDARKAGMNSPGFNQPLGAFDALLCLLDWVKENWVEVEGKK